MTLQQWADQQNITLGEEEKYIENCKGYGGCYGGVECDFALTPQGLELNGVTETCQPELKVKREFYTWEQVLTYLTAPRQLTFF